MATFLFILGECRVQPEYFNLKLLSSAFQKQDDLPPASPFLSPSNLIVLFKGTHLIFEQEKLCCTLIENINSEDWNKSLWIVWISTIQSHNDSNLCYWIDQIFNLFLGKGVVCIWATWVKLTPNTTSAESMSLTLQNLVFASCHARLWMILFGEKKVHKILYLLFFPLLYKAGR